MPRDGAAERGAVVIGAGIGGLSAAAALAAQGVPVTVLERAATPGGKMREVTAGGAALDAGPTVFTMRWIFDGLFEEAGARLDDHLRLLPVDRLARHGWTDGSRFDLYADPDRAAAAVADFAGPAEARRYLAFRDRARRIYSTLEGPFIADQRPNTLDLIRRVGLSRLGALFETTPFQTMAKALAASFEDRRLRQLFGRYATYCGSSPYAAPATLMLVAHVELAGVWLVEGGMHRVARAVEALAKANGAAFRYGAHVEAIETEGGRVSAVRLAGGERVPADFVVANADAGALGAGLFGPEAAAAVPKVARRDRSISAMVWSARAETRGFPLTRHTVFFDEGDYAREFDAIFRSRRTPEAPTVYICAQDRGEDAPDAALGPERLHIHVNAPADGDAAPITDEDIALCRTRTLTLLERCGLTLDLTPDNSVLTTPTGFEALFPGTGGALFGPATHGAFGAFARPGARTRLPGLYLAGGSVHPGAGVPMAAMGGRLAAAAALQDLGRRDRASISRSAPRAISGGTSTPSPTTASAG
ncbi:MAG: phytoene desaturase [Rhodobacteraceae bacterium]|nr:MAG: phytoene desaturase [Paracoccaceae bacterium]